MTVGIVIVGAGECGARAAFVLRENGYEHPITLIGAEAHLPYERPPLSKLALGDAPKFVAAQETYEAKGIAVLLSTKVERIITDAHEVVLQSGRTLPYDKLLLATGATPRTLPGTTGESGRVLTMCTFDDALAFRRHLRVGSRVVIVGGGFIGLELAALARSSGADVAILETQSRVLSRGVPEEIARMIVDRHLSEGVEIVCGVGIKAVTEGERSVEVLLEDGSGFEADVVMVGIGVIPNTQIAEAAGLKIENGIAVNEKLETSITDIYAAGDCCSFPMSHYQGRRVRLEAWRNAQDQGTLAARSMLGHAEAGSSVPWMWSDQYDLTLQVTGLADGSTSSVRRNFGDGGRMLFHLDAGGRLLAASGIGAGNSIAKDMRVAEMLIAGAASPDINVLADPDQKLRSLLSR